MIQRIAIIPASIIGGLLFAAAGGFYVWHEMAVPPIPRSMNSATPPAVVALLPASSRAAMPELPLAINPVNKLETKPLPVIKSKRLSDANELPQSEAPKDNARPIRIEHSLNSNAIEPVLLDAWNAYRKGDFDNASVYYSEVLRKDVQNHKSANRDALLGMAAIAQQRSQDDTAAQYYKQLLALDPRDPDANAGMSSLFGTTGNTESRLKLLIEERPEAAALYFALGNHYAEQSRWGEAEQAYFSAAALESDNAQFAFNLAVSLDHLGQKKIAIQHYQQALQMDQISNPGFDRVQTQLRLDELLMLP